MTWRSRDKRRLKITPEIWGQIERFTKAAAKRATTLPRFMEALKPRLGCDTLNPRWMEVASFGAIQLNDYGELAEYGAAPDRREFLTNLIDHAPKAAVLDALYRETAYVILLVRDRLERERPIESNLARDTEGSAQLEGLL